MINSNQMPKEKQKILENFLNRAQGKPLMQALPLLMETKKQLSEHNFSFTQEDASLILQTLSKDLSASEKEQLKRIQNMIASQNK